MTNASQSRVVVVTGGSKGIGRGNADAGICPPAIRRRAWRAAFVLKNFLLTKPSKALTMGREESAARRKPGGSELTGDICQTFRIFGDVGSDVYAGWIARHARRLGLRGAILHHGADRLDLVVTGQADLVDALALGCSLGPQEVLVDRIDRRLTAPQSRDDFSSPQE